MYPLLLRLFETELSISSRSSDSKFSDVFFDVILLAHWAIKFCIACFLLIF